MTVTLPVASSCAVKFWQFATGGILSLTVTIAIQESTLPLGPVPIRVTLLGPISAQVKVRFGWPLSVRVVKPQLSAEPPSTSAGTIVTVPAALRFTEILLQTITGAKESITVTVALHTEALPLLSVTVKVTTLGPTSAQVKADGVTELAINPQASLAEAVTSAAVILAFPVPSSAIVVS